MTPQEMLQVNSFTSRTKSQFKTFEHKDNVIISLAEKTAAIGESVTKLSREIAILRISENNNDAVYDLAEHVAVLDVYANRLLAELAALKSVNQ